MTLDIHHSYRHIILQYVGYKSIIRTNCNILLWLFKIRKIHLNISTNFIFYQISTFFIVINKWKLLIYKYGWGKLFLIIVRRACPVTFLTCKKYVLYNQWFDFLNFKFCQLMGGI